MSVATAIARGIVQGVDRYGENERRAIQMERDEKRFNWEEEEQNEKKRIREARNQFAERMRGAREAFASGQLPGQEDNLIQQPGMPTGTMENLPATGGTAITPETLPATGQAPAPTPMAAPRSSAIAAPNAPVAPAAAAAPAQEQGGVPRSQDIFKSNGEGLYRDQKRANDAYWQTLRDITAEFYEQTGQVDKLMEVDKQISTWRSSSYDELRKATAAAVATGDPEALRMVSKVAELSGLGIKVDPKSGKFDPESQTYKGVKMVGMDGKEVTQDLSATRLLTVIGSLSPEKLIEFNFARADAERSAQQDERRTRATERTADAAVMRSQADMVTATANRDRADSEQKAADIKTRSEILTSMFPNAGRVLKPEEMVAMSQEQRAQFDQSVATDSRNLALAQALSALNPRLDPRVAAQVVRNPGAYQVAGEEGGRPFTMVGSQKVFLR